MREPKMAPQSGSSSGLESAFASAPRLGQRFVDRGLIPESSINEVLELQRRWGCRFGEALIAKDLIKPIELAETLAESLGARFVDLLHEPPDPELIHPEFADLYLKSLFVPWRMIGSTRLIACADPCPEVRRLIAKLYGPDARIVITGKFDVIWTAQRVFQDRLNRDATLRLDDNAPELSARRVATPRQKRVGVAFAAGLLAALCAAPSLATAFAMLLVAVCYAANIILRLVLFAAAAIGRGTGHHVGKSEIAGLDEARLPVYSILVPLYREENMVSRVTSALKSFDYPAAKLDIKTILEQDDDATIAAAKALRLDGRFEILVVPQGELRTKPRACNYAMRFVRGAFVVIYDAEDEPEPDQLKKVIAAFRAAPDVACFQARLNVYNPDENWLTRGLMAQTPENRRDFWPEDSHMNEVALE
jgi:hypothetical protein